MHVCMLLYTNYEQCGDSCIPVLENGSYSFGCSRFNDDRMLVDRRKMFVRIGRRGTVAVGDDHTYKESQRSMARMHRRPRLCKHGIRKHEVPFVPQAGLALR